jgi:GR25 family glycosyltransferase involved in LPS biosynthesis
MHRATADILTGDGKVRSPQLVQQIRDLGMDPIVIQGVNAKNVDIKPVFSQILTRYLLPGEIAALKTHHAAHRLAFKSGATGIFFEDDAIVSQEFNPQVLNGLLDVMGKFKKPTILSLFGPDWNVLSRNKTITLQYGLVLHKAWFPPAGAVAYIANLSAMEVASKSPLKFNLPADWPEWSGKCDFYVSSPSCVQHSDGSSIEGVRENRRLKAVEILKMLLSPSSILTFVRFRMKKIIIWRLAGIKSSSATRTSSRSRIFL